jgi:hypothetical protein
MEDKRIEPRIAVYRFHYGEKRFLYGTRKGLKRNNY